MNPKRPPNTTVPELISRSWQLPDLGLGSAFRPHLISCLFNWQLKDTLKIKNLWLTASPLPSFPKSGLFWPSAHSVITWLPDLEGQCNQNLDHKILAPQTFKHETHV